jgi:hypothetical protein
MSANTRHKAFGEKDYVKQLRSAQKNINLGSLGLQKVESQRVLNSQYTGVYLKPLIDAKQLRTVLQRSD